MLNSTLNLIFGKTVNKLWRKMGLHFWNEPRYEDIKFKQKGETNKIQHCWALPAPAVRFLYGQNKFSFSQSEGKHGCQCAEELLC